MVPRMIRTSAFTRHSVQVKSVRGILLIAQNRLASAYPAESTATTVVRIAKRLSKDMAAVVGN